jgi:hypothetical protein
MGLAIHVGALTRYVTGGWKTIIQPTGREEDLPVVIQRTESFASQWLDTFAM